VEGDTGHKQGTQSTLPWGVESSEVFYNELKASEKNSCFKIQNKGSSTEVAVSFKVWRVLMLIKKVFRHG